MIFDGGVVHYRNNPPVSLAADSPLYTKGPIYGFRTSDFGHWFGMTETGRRGVGTPPYGALSVAVS